MTGDPGRALVRPEQCGEHPHGRGLAGAVGSEHAEYGAARDLEIDACQCLGAAERLLEAGCLDR